ncbi:hypothetical protein EJF18_70192 [Clavispora lusitaniae]|uniref:Uncharacterized protein n=1 Tax=Clavispora lusitaniae TaxID=36911 RepID=A0ACD0WSG9_CLALS|nr:hypothetical protein E0198_004810 [Clavispora lusitaniae]QFZ30121.1 hypothetical protein EJF14_70192 [Clavispora lusitaniae]QFZ35785.1 hypothetical protein EJF16_70192 [Clavispora lusitaniae]QFZ41467.1 hypothetical protein EJF15_70192 [Clavispora lusitaniae]QFZ47145.1 hypothetical protein EJF18_70192 [Clavispora lusitaniae]
MSDPKQRIISHMNKDHQLALVDYVVIYGNVPLASFVPSSVQISDVNESQLDISYQKIDGEKKTLPIVWNHAVEREGVAVHSLSDVKGKLVAMAKYAADKQGYSHVQIKTVAYPRRPLEIGLYVFGAAILATLYDKHLLRRLAANDRLFSAVASYLPFLGKVHTVFENHVKTIAVAMYGIHIVEIFTWTLPLARKYRIPFPQRLGWAAMNFVEGFMVPRRLKSLVA